MSGFKIHLRLYLAISVSDENLENVSNEVAKSQYTTQYDHLRTLFKS
jgi:hypothetical protein